MILAVDAGQSGIRAATDRAAGAVLSVRGVRRMEDGIGPGEVVADLLAALAPLDLGRAAVETVAVGLSGFELAGEDDLRAIAAGLRARTGAQRVALATDGVTSLLGALGREAGVAVAVGTGVVVLGHDGAGGWARVDGWGATLGDDGGGYAIGVAGLRAALRAHDGRAGGSPLLLEAVRARFGSVGEMPRAVHRRGPAAPVAAAFVPAVADAARAGCPVAAATWRRAGEELAGSAFAAIERTLPAARDVAVAPVGGVWGVGELLRAPFATALAARCPHARVVAPAGGSLDGALELGRGAPRLAAVPGLLWWDVP